MWAQDKAAGSQDAALARLRQLRVLVPDREKAGGAAGAAADASSASLRLHPALRDHLRVALYDFAPEPPPAPPPHLAALVPTLAELEAVATERWEALLLFLVGASGPPPPAEGSECVPVAARALRAPALTRALASGWMWPSCCTLRS